MPFATVLDQMVLLRGDLSLEDAGDLSLEDAGDLSLDDTGDEKLAGLDWSTAVIRKEDCGVVCVASATVAAPKFALV